MHYYYMYEFNGTISRHRHVMLYFFIYLNYGFIFLSIIWDRNEIIRVNIRPNHGFEGWKNLLQQKWSAHFTHLHLRTFRPETNFSDNLKMTHSITHWCEKEQHGRSELNDNIAINYSGRSGLHHDVFYLSVKKIANAFSTWTV